MTNPAIPRVRLNVARTLIWGAAIFIACLYFNYGAFQAPSMDEANDVSSIMDGYHAGHWWAFGRPWIESSTPSYRPLSSLLLGGDCWLIEHNLPVAPVGFFLLWILAGISAGVAWRITGTGVAAIAGGTMAAGALLMNTSQPDYWLAWWPVHHDILNAIWMLGVIYCALVYVETRSRSSFAGGLACFAAGLLTKEFAYIFGAMALVATWSRLTVAERRMGVLLALTLPALAFALRCAFVSHPYMPPPFRIRWEHIGGFRYPMETHLLRKPWLNLAHPFYRYVLTADWVPVLVAMSFALSASLLVDGKTLYATLTFGVLTILAVLLSSDLTSDTTVFFTMRAEDSFEMVATAFVFARLVAHKRIAILVLLVLAYVPVVTLLGWHYWLPGAFMRAAVLWPMAGATLYEDACQLAQRLHLSRDSSVRAGA